MNTKVRYLPYSNVNARIVRMVHTMHVTLDEDTYEEGV